MRWAWQASIGGETAFGTRHDHRGDAGDLADQIGTEFRLALGRGAPVVTVTVTPVDAEGPPGAGAQTWR